MRIPPITRLPGRVKPGYSLPGVTMGLSVVFFSACIPVLYSDGTELGPWEAPVNSWPFNEPPSDLVGEGFDEGQVVPDFRMMDQNAQEVSLWQFYGMVTLVDVSTGWCAPCQELAGDVQPIADDYRHDGFVYLTVMPEDVEGNVPDEADLDEWAEHFGIAEPVLSDDESWSLRVVPDRVYPAIVVVDRDMTVASRPAGDDASIRDAIEEIL